MFKQKQQQHKRNKTESIQTPSQYIQYTPPNRNKRKFIQHSIFLPIIKNKQSPDNEQKLRQIESRSRRHEEQDYQINYYQQQLKQQQSQSSTTMEYINQCERIIQNLKKLTAFSTNRLDRKKIRLYSRKQGYEQRQLYQDEQINLITSRSKRETLNSKNQHSRLKGGSVRQEHRVKTSANQYSNSYQDGSDMQIKIINSPRAHIGGKKSTAPLKQRQDDKQDKKFTQQDIKAQQQLKKAQKRQNVLIKFLGKARNRGFELQKKIAEFRMKKNLQNKQKQGQPSAQINNSKKQQPKKPSKNSNPEKQSTSPSKNLPQIKPDQKQKKSK